MSEGPVDSEAAPVFKRCPRCHYSLRGLPANHACPECGLRYDERCALFRAANPRQILLGWLLMFASGPVILRNLPHLARLESASTWDKLGALFAVLWIAIFICAVWFFGKRYRRGFEVVITGDGLMARLPGITEQLIGWDRIESASAKDSEEGKQQTAHVQLRSPSKALVIGGIGNVFPTRSDVERFVSEVNARAAAADPSREGATARPKSTD